MNHRTLSSSLTLIPALLLVLLSGTARARAQVLPPANLAARVSANPLPASENGPVTVTVTVTNRGNAPAGAVSINNRLPQGFSFVRSEPAGAVNLGGQEGEEVVIGLGNLPAGATATATITARATAVRFDGAEGIIGTNVTRVAAVNLESPILVPIPVPVFVLRDFGDAPDQPYPVLRASNGARHRLSGLYLGASVDAELDGQPSLLANGDDTSNTDDEDGVVFLNSWTIGGVANVQVTASLAGVLDVWADFTADGDWADAGEHAVVGAAIPAGVSTLAIPVPAWAAAGRCYLRFRLSPAGAPTPVGYINGGEVEDYVVEVKPPGAPGNAGDLKVLVRAGRMVVTWSRPNALLQAAATPNGPWVTLPDASSPYEVPTDSRQRLFRLIEGSSVSRNGLERQNFASLAREADLIVDAVVTDVIFRNSDGDGTNDVSWPHTFVKLHVLEVLKGRVADSNLCLRFLGGLDADGDRIMHVSQSTSFDVGERSILFVKRNGFLARPLAGGEKGRLRVVNGLMYSEEGHRLVLTPSQRLAFGVRDELAEVAENHFGAQFLGRGHSESTGESPRPERPTGTHLSVTAFKTMLGQFIHQIHSPDELEHPALTLSTDPTRPFRIARPRQVAPPADPGSGTETPAIVDEETLRVRAQGGNPVLR